MQNEFLFTLPVSGKQVCWKPLTVRQSLDITAANKLTPHMLNPQLLISRITKMDGDTTPSYATWGEWEEFDLEAFAEEVEAKESMRRSAFRKQRMDGDVWGNVDKAIEDAQLAASQLGLSLKILREAQHAARSASDPLAPTT